MIEREMDFLFGRGDGLVGGTATNRPQVRYLIGSVSDVFGTKKINRLRSPRCPLPLPQLDS
jgi:hypothetical protein